MSIPNSNRPVNETRPMTPQHTPGPWSAVALGDTSDTYRHVQAVNAGKAALQIAHDGSPEGMANERLALAAPALLAALRSALASLESVAAFRDSDGELRIVPDNGGSLCYSGTVLCERIEKARAALAQAEGKPDA